MREDDPPKFTALDFWFGVVMLVFWIGGVGWMFYSLIQMFTFILYWRMG